MHTSQALAILALASQALALPQWGGWGNGWWHHNDNSVDSSSDDSTPVNVAVVTAYTTVTYGGGNGGNWNNWHAPTATAAPAPAPTATGSTPPSTNTGYMAVVDEWRGKLGLSSLSCDSKLEANAMKTAQDGNGEMVHELNPGSMAQVLAPGDSNEFEHVFVGGWLCERPSTPGLNGVCDQQSAGWSYGGQTGHADILCSGSYSKIGCALANGIWACDLA